MEEAEYSDIRFEFWAKKPVDRRRECGQDSSRFPGKRTAYAPWHNCASLWIFRGSFHGNKMPEAAHQQRRAERRTSKAVAPPPYETSNGMVLTDRRSSLDRRASWIREFSLETMPGRES